MPALLPPDAPPETKRKPFARLLPFRFATGRGPGADASAGTPEGGAGEGTPKTPCADCRRRPALGFSCVRPAPGAEPPADGDYKNQDRRGWVKTDHDFGGADLQGCRLQDADLSRSDLSRVKNLLPEQLSGANLRGTSLPTDIRSFEALTHVKELSENAGKLLVSLLAACAFMLLTIARMTDVQVLTGSATAKLPLVDAEISVKLFFLFGPLILLGLYFAFHLYLQRLWETLATLPAIFPDGTPLDRKSYPWLVNDLVRLYFKHLRPDPMRTPLMFFQEKLWEAVVYWLPPVLLVPFWARYLCCRSWPITSLHMLMLAVGVWSAIMFHHLARITLERDQTKICAWQNGWLRVMGEHLTYKAALGALALVLFSAAAFYGHPPEEPAGVGLWNIARQRALQAVPWLLDETHASAFARLQDPRLPAQHGAAGDGTAGDSTAAALQGTDLRYARAEGADLSGANLTWANLRHANLQDASLADADLTGADLREADLDYISHKKARYWFLAQYDSKQCALLGLPSDHDARIKDYLAREGDNIIPTHLNCQLDGYNLAGSPLRRTSLRYASLKKANLQYADLHDADLRGADLTKASLIGADLGGAQMRGATLTGADLQGAHLENALLTDGNGAADIHCINTAENWILAHYNPQQLSLLELANDHETRLKNSNFSGLVLTGMNLRYSNLIRFHLEDATLYQAKLEGAHLRAAFLNRVKAREAHLDGADLSGADLRLAHLEGAGLCSADLSEADLKGADLSGADLRHADLRQAHLEGAHLKRTLLTEAGLAGAYYDPRTTQWPTPDFPLRHPEMHKSEAAPSPERGRPERKRQTRP